MPSPKMASKPADSEEAVRLAHRKVLAARDRVAVAAESQRTARAAVGVAVNAWHSQFAKVTHESLVRDGARRDMDRALAIKAGTLKVDPVPPVQYQSHLDQVFAATGKRGGSVNRGTRRPTPRLLGR
jgi:hypothetical protein